MLPYLLPAPLDIPPDLPELDDVVLDVENVVLSTLKLDYIQHANRSTILRLTL